MNLSLQHSLWPEKRGGENNKQPAMAASSFPPSKYILAYKFRSNEKKAIFIIKNTENGFFNKKSGKKIRILYVDGYLKIYFHASS